MCGGDKVGSGVSKPYRHNATTAVEVRHAWSEKRFAVPVFVWVVLLDLVPMTVGTLATPEMQPAE